MKFAKNVLMLNLILLAFCCLFYLGISLIGMLQNQYSGYARSGFSFWDGLFIIICYLATVFLIYLFYRFGIKKYSLLALPISFLILPFFLYVILVVIRDIGDVNSCPAGWEIWAFIVAIFYSLPFAIATFIASLCMKRSSLQ